MQCKSCGRVIPEDSVFCAYCGEKHWREQVCSKCGAVMGEEFRFCTKCGGSLNGGEAQPDGQIARASAPVYSATPAIDGYYDQYEAHLRKQAEKRKQAFGRFKEAENRSNLIKNALLSLFSLVVLICCFFNFITISADSLSFGADFTGFKIRQSSVQLLSAAFGPKEESALEFIEDAQSILSANVSADTLRKLSEDGYGELSNAQKREVDSALGKINFCKVFFFEEVAPNAKTSIAWMYALSSLIVLLMLAAAAQLAVGIVGLCQRRKMKLFTPALLVGFAIAMLCCLAVNIVFNIPGGSSVGSALVCCMLFEALGIAAAVAHNAVFTAIYKGRLKANIKAAVVSALSVIVACTCFAATNTLSVKASEESGRKNDVGAVLDGSGYLGIGDGLTAEEELPELSAVYQVILQMSQTNRDLANNLKQLGVSMVNTADMLETYEYAMVLGAFIPYLQFLTFAAMGVILILMLLSFLCGKDASKVAAILSAAGGVVLTVAVTVFAGVLGWALTDSATYLKVPVTMGIGAGAIANVVLTIGLAVLCAVVLKSKKRDGAPRVYGYAPNGYQNVQENGQTAVSGDSRVQSAFNGAQGAENAASGSEATSERPEI